MKPNQIITEDFIKRLESSEIPPWKKPWKIIGHQNLYTRTKYRGYNRLITSMSPYTCPYWATFNAISSHGGSVKEGEHGTIVTFYKRVESTLKEDDTVDAYWLLRYYRIFNLEQTEGIEIPHPEEITPPARIDTIDKEMKTYAKREGLNVVERVSERAYYSPIEDTVVVPSITQYSDSGEFYSTYFHELIHSTGHWDRLGRFSKTEVNTFGSDPYAKEELVAELGSAFLRGYYGILEESKVNSAAYLKAWIERLRKDNNLIIHAASAAQKAYDLYLGLKEEVE